MIIFHSYVSLPEGKYHDHDDQPGESGKVPSNDQSVRSRIPWDIPSVASSPVALTVIEHGNQPWPMYR